MCIAIQKRKAEAVVKISTQWGVAIPKKNTLAGFRYSATIKLSTNAANKPQDNNAMQVVTCVTPSVLCMSNLRQNVRMTTIDARIAETRISADLTQ